MTPLLLIPGMMCDARLWGGLPARLHPRPVGHVLPTGAASMAALAAAAQSAPTRFQLACMTLPYSAFPLERALTGIRAAGYDRIVIYPFLVVDSVYTGGLSLEQVNKALGEDAGGDEGEDDTFLVEEEEEGDNMSGLLDTGGKEEDEEG